MIIFVIAVVINVRRVFLRIYLYLPRQQGPLFTIFYDKLASDHSFIYQAIILHMIAVHFLPTAL